MLKKLGAALVVYLAVAMPAHAQWDGNAVQALTYLYHVQELKADITALDARLRQAYTQRLHDYYLAEVNKQPFVTQFFPEPLVYDDLSGQYVTLYQDIQNDFLQRIEADEDGILSRLENDERQDFRNHFPSAVMVELKEAYLRLSAFFDLPLSFVNYRRLSQDVVADSKLDLPQRQALAVPLAAALRLQEARYSVTGDELHDAPPDVVEKNLTATLTNNYTAAQLGALLQLAQGDAGQGYLRLKDHAFANRFNSMQEMFRVELAAAVDAMPARVANLPPMVYSAPVFFKHHRRRHHDDND